MSTIKRSVDVAIIGAGTAGMGAYRTARAHTDNLVLIEGSHYGTTCARVGCMPSKLLIAAAEAAHGVTAANQFGVITEPPRIDGPAVMDRVRRERDRFVGFVEDAVEDFPPEHKIVGTAKFIDDHHLDVEGYGVIHARAIVIATGSRPNVPGFLQAAQEHLMVNDDVFELQDIPRRVAVFGPGVIGLELGQALHRLGANVHMFGVGGAVGPLQDPEIRAYALETFNEEFYLDPDAQVKDLELVDGSVRIEFVDRTGASNTIEVDKVLAATGRRPNVDRLGIENTTLELDARGNPTFDRFSTQTSVPHIFIAGDANSDIPLLHEAADEGRIAGDNAGRVLEGSGIARSGLRRTPLAAVFTDPQMATVGLSIQQVQERCRSCYAEGLVSFEDQGRSRVMGKNKGLAKVYGEQGTGLLLGAEIFGPAAEHLGHLLAWAIQQRLTVSQVLDMPFYHPVIEEGLRTALRDLNAKLHLGPEMIERCLDCGPGA